MNWLQSRRRSGRMFLHLDSGGIEVHSLLQSVKDNPNALFVLQDIDKAQPEPSQDPHDRLEPGLH